MAVTAADTRFHQYITAYCTSTATTDWCHSLRTPELSMTHRLQTCKVFVTDTFRDIIRSLGRKFSPWEFRGMDGLCEDALSNRFRSFVFKKSECKS